MINTTNTNNTNDTMLLKLVKNMVHLGKYTDGELLTAVTRVTTDPAVNFLAMCKLSMEAILRFKEMLLQEITIDYNLAARLSEPLFATQIQLNVNITEEQAAAAGHVELLTEKSKLQGGWNTEDTIIDGL